MERHQYLAITDSISFGSLAKADFGIPIPARANICKLRNLSLENELRLEIQRL